MLETRRLTILMVLVFIAITIFWIVSYWAISNYFGRPSNASDVGQLFGAIGALFSGWAFCGVLWAILLQRNAIEIQREDLKATIAEMKQSREAQEESADNLRAQVETMLLQSRVQALNTLINVPLQIKGNTFLSGFSDQSVHVVHFMDTFSECVHAVEMKKPDQTVRAAHREVRCYSTSCSFFGPL